MRILRKEAYYRDNLNIRIGDEFRQVVLKHYSELTKGQFRVEVFKGFSGKPPKNSSVRKDFDTEEAATLEFERIVALIRAEGFVRYIEGTPGDPTF